jgi:hypothetical protein
VAPLSRTSADEAMNQFFRRMTSGGPLGPAGAAKATHAEASIAANQAAAVHRKVRWFVRRITPIPLPEYQN